MSNPADGQRAYSSVWANEASGAGHGRGTLDSPQGWSSLHNSVGQYMQLNMGTLATLCGVSVQGRADYGQWITSFKVQVSTNCDSGSAGIYTDVDGGRIFNGNSDQASERQVSSHYASPSATGRARSCAVRLKLHSLLCLGRLWRACTSKVCPNFPTVLVRPHVDAGWSFGQSFGMHHEQSS